MKRIFSVGVMCLFLCLVLLQSVVLSAGKGGVNTIIGSSLTDCLITSTGGLKCVGSNQIGTLGIGKKKAPQVKNGVYYSLTPMVPLGLSSGVKYVDGNSDLICAVTTAGGVKCWGSNSYGTLGIGTDKGPEECPPYPGISSEPVPCSTKPLDVKGVTGAIAVSVGGSFACALLKTGTVKCWGENKLGQLGSTKGGISYGGYTYGKDSLVAVDVDGLTGATAIVSGTAHSCALLSSGAVKCWGFNADGELGTGQPIKEADFSLKPVAVSGISGATQISADNGSTCVLLAGGKVKCWGWINQVIEGASCDEMQEVQTEMVGSSGEGEDKFEQSCAKTSKPLEIPGLSGTKLLANSGTCALMTDGTVKCWSAWGYTPYPVEQLNGESIVELFARASGCALLSNGKVKCWGAYYAIGFDENATDNGMFAVVDIPLTK